MKGLKECISQKRKKSNQKDNNPPNLEEMEINRRKKPKVRINGSLLTQGLIIEIANWDLLEKVRIIDRQLVTSSTTSTEEETPPSPTKCKYKPI